MKPEFDFFKRYIDREPFLTALWLRVAHYQCFGEEAYS